MVKAIVSGANGTSVGRPVVTGLDALRAIAAARRPPAEWGQVVMATEAFVALGYSGGHRRSDVYKLIKSGKIRGGRYRVPAINNNQETLMVCLADFVKAAQEGLI